MAEVNETNVNETNEQNPEKTFTQEEVNAIVAKRVAKEKKGMPSEEELNAYRTWKESQQTESQKLADAIKDRDASKVALDAANAEITKLKRSNYIASKGITGDAAEFLLFKAEKMVDDKTTFEQAVDSLTAKEKPSFDWQAPVGNGNRAQTPNSVMNDLIRNARK